MRLSQRADAGNDPIFLSRVKMAVVMQGTTFVTTETSTPEEIAHGKQIIGAPDYFTQLYAVQIAALGGLALDDTVQGDDNLIAIIRDSIAPGFIREIFVQWQPNPEDTP